MKIFKFKEITLNTLQKYSKQYKNQIKIIYKNKLYSLSNFSFIIQNNEKKLKMKCISFLNKIISNDTLLLKSTEYEDTKKINKNCGIILEFSVEQIFKMKYKIKDINESVKIFGEIFVENNADKYIIIDNNKLFSFNKVKI